MEDRVNIRGLRDGNGVGLIVVPDLNAKHSVQLAKVGDLNVTA